MAIDEQFLENDFSLPDEINYQHLVEGPEQSMVSFLQPATTHSVGAMQSRNFAIRHKLASVGARQYEHLSIDQ